MKKFNRYFCLFLVAFALMGACSLCFVQPVSAAETDYDDQYVSLARGFYLYDYTSASSLYTDLEISIFDPDNPVTYPFITFGSTYDSESSLRIYFNSFGYDVNGDLYLFASGTHPSSVIPAYSVIPLETMLSIYEGNAYIYFPYDVAFPRALAECFTPYELDPPDSPSVPSSGGMYGSIYGLIVNSFYGDSEITGAQELVATTLATTAIVFMFAIPFLIVWKIIKVVAHI